MDTQRLILFFVFSFSLLLIWTEWEKEQRPKPAPVAAGTLQPGVVKAVPGAVPTPITAAPKPAAMTAVPPPALTTGEIIQVNTDLFVADIDTLGGSLVKLELLKHRETNDQSKNLVLLGPEHQYFAQSGLTGDGGPNHRTLWRALPGERTLGEGQKSLELRLAAEGKDGLSVEKVYTFKRDSYIVDVALELRNGGGAAVAPHAYFQLTHDGKQPAGGSSLAQSFGAQSFNGFAQYTTDRKFEKVQFSDIDKGKVDHAKQATDGWIAFVQHYFVAAWVPTVPTA